jgi:hypothetical protein
MAGTGTIEARRIKIYEQIAKIIEKTENSGVKRQDILDSLSESHFCSSYMAIDALKWMVNDGRIIRVGGVGSTPTRYFLPEDESKKKAVEKDIPKADTYVNPVKENETEEKSDPTAAAAIGHTMDGFPLPGEIWSKKFSNGDTHDVLVIASTSDYASVVALSDSTYPIDYNNAYLRQFWSKNGKEYWYDSSRLATSPAKYLRRTNDGVEAGIFEGICVELNKFLNLCPVVEKVKVVEKPVEVVKEVVKEVPVKDVPDTAALDQTIELQRKRIAVLEGKIEVYREAFRAFGKN